MAVRSSEVAIVRDMRGTDIDCVMEVESESYEFPWSANIFRDCLRAGYLCRVLEFNQQIAGYGLMSYGAGECHVLNLCVSAEHRRKGYARRILTHFIAWARRHNAASIFLEVRQSNEGACQLYEGFGFKSIGVRSNYYPSRDGREDAYVFFLQLTG